MWRERILARTDKATFHGPAPKRAIRECEAALGQVLPDELAGLLSESNGVEGEYELGLVWPVQRIKADNVAFRSNTDFASL